MLTPFRFVRALALTGTLSMLACTQAPFSVPENSQSGLRITPAGSTIEQGKTIQLHAFIDEPSNRGLAATEVVWSSSAPATAYVDNNGLVVGGSAGQATITAEFGGNSAIAIVGVVAGNEGPTCVAAQQVPNHCPVLSR